MTRPIKEQLEAATNKKVRDRSNLDVLFCGISATSRATFDLRKWLLLGGRLVHPGGIVLGFEATPRDDLPEPLERLLYSLDGKRRAIMIHRP